MATTQGTPHYTEAVAFVDRSEYTATTIYLRRDDASKPGRLNSPIRVSLELVRWAIEQGYTAISDNGTEWHSMTDVVAYLKAGRRSDRIWRGMW